MRKLFDKIDWKGYGIKLDGKFTNNIKFANDEIQLISENYKEIHKLTK